jgi:hypothetical protein
LARDELTIVRNNMSVIFSWSLLQHITSNDLPTSLQHDSQNMESAKTGLCEHTTSLASVEDKKIIELRLEE